MATTSPSPLDAGTTTEIADVGGHGGRFATILSGFALLFSGFSFYKSVLEAPDLAVFVPPVIHYARDSGGDIELFAIPLTIANEGARTGTVISMELEVEDARSKTRKRYYSAYMGEHPRNPDTVSRAFAPLSIAGRATFSDTIRFYPEGNPLPKLVDEAGDYRFTLRLNTVLAAAPGGSESTRSSDAKPITFELTLPWISDQQLGMRRAAIAMHVKDWKPTAGAGPVK